MPRAGGRGGRFAIRPCETMSLGRVGRSAEGVSRPATVFLNLGGRQRAGAGPARSGGAERVQASA